MLVTRSVRYRRAGRCRLTREGASGFSDPDGGGVLVPNPMRSPETIISALEMFPEELGRAIFGGNDPESLIRPASDGGWGVVEILPHLADWEEIYIERIRKTAQEDRPYLPGFDDSLWSIERDYRGQNPRASFARLSELRAGTVEFLKALPAESWTRTGEHGYYGEVTLQWLADHICDHDQEHLQQARDALAA
jgi:hypothetical protein